MGNMNIMTTEEFIKKAQEIHGDEYDYSKCKFINWDTKVKLICKIHGEFDISPRHHIYRKHGCSKCRGRHISESKRHSIEWFLENAEKIHTDKYDYSKVEYKGIDEDVCIICPIHGEFWQLPCNHIFKRCGCPSCRYEELSEKFRTPISILKSKFFEKHNNKYLYPNLDKEYINNRSEITIRCPIHGEFKQTVMKHTQGQGCPYCNESKLEKEITSFLEINKINFIRQQKFDWLIFKKPMSVDFYLPDYKIAIECQGEQHFKPIPIFGGVDGFKLITERDDNKRKLCKSNNITLLYYTKYKDVNGDDIYKNKKYLLKKILENDNN